MSAYSWDIIRKKGKGIMVEAPISKDEWEAFVNEDPTFSWWDDSPY